MDFSRDRLRNPSSLKTQFAFRFVRSLNKLHKGTPNIVGRCRRYRFIRDAAYASMARSVGPTRNWTRALLHSRTVQRIPKNSYSLKRRRTEAENPRKKTAAAQENNLRRIVPGGEAMDFCKLLNETGEYIKCLEAQVQVMKQILDHYTN